MPEWFVVGGWSMWFIAGIGGLALLAAAGFAWRPDPTQLPRIEALSRAIAWCIVTGVSVDLAAVGFAIPSKPEWAKSPEMPLIAMQGFAESMSPAVFGGAILSIVSLLCAAGHVRMRARGAAV